MPYRPYHVHTSDDFLEPGEVYELDVEIIPTSIVVPRGYRLGLSVLGRDFDHGKSNIFGKWGERRVHGCSLFTHKDPATRPADIYNGLVTVRSTPDRPSYLTLPIVPPAG